MTPSCDKPSSKSKISTAPWIHFAPTFCRRTHATLLSSPKDRWTKSASCRRRLKLTSSALRPWRRGRDSRPVCFFSGLSSENTQNAAINHLAMSDVFHALGLHMHQPLGNLVALHNSSERWEARQILWCYDRPTRMLEGYEDVARL